MSNTVAILGVGVKVDPKTIKAARDDLDKSFKDADINIDVSGFKDELVQEYDLAMKEIKKRSKNINLTDIQRRFHESILNNSDIDYQNDQLEAYVKTLQNLVHLTKSKGFKDITFNNLTPANLDKILVSNQKLIDAQKELEAIEEKRKNTKNKAVKFEGKSLDEILKKYESMNNFEYAANENRLNSIKESIVLKKELSAKENEELVYYSKLLYLYKELSKKDPNIKSGSEERIKRNKELLAIAGEIFEVEKRIGKYSEKSGAYRISMASELSGTKELQNLKSLELVSGEVENAINSYVNKIINDLEQALKTKIKSLSEVFIEQLKKLNDQNVEKAAEKKEQREEKSVSKSSSNKNSSDDIAESQNELDKYIVTLEEAKKKITELSKSPNIQGQHITEKNIEQWKDLIGYLQQYIELYKKANNIELNSDQDIRNLLKTEFGLTDLKYANKFLLKGMSNDPYFNSLKELKEYIIEANKITSESKESNGDFGDSSGTGSGGSGIGATAEDAEKLIAALNEIKELITSINEQFKNIDSDGKYAKQLLDEKEEIKENFSSISMTIQQELADAFKGFTDDLAHIDDRDWKFPKLQETLLNIVEQFRASLSTVGFTSTQLDDAYRVLKGWNDASYYQTRYVNKVDSERGSFFNQKTGKSSNSYFFDGDESFSGKNFELLEKLSVGISGELSELYDTFVHSHPIRKEKNGLSFKGSDIGFSFDDLKIAVNKFLDKQIPNMMVTSNYKFSNLDLTGVTKELAKNLLAQYKSELVKNGLIVKDNGSVSIPDKLIKDKNTLDLDKSTDILHKSLRQALKNVGLEESRLTTGDIDELQFDLSELKAKEELAKKEAEEFFNTLKKIADILQEINNNGFKLSQSEDVNKNDGLEKLQSELDETKNKLQQVTDEAIELKNQIHNLNEKSKISENLENNNLDLKKNIKKKEEDPSSIEVLPDIDEEKWLEEINSALKSIKTKLNKVQIDVDIDNISFSDKEESESKSIENITEKINELSSSIHKKTEEIVKEELQMRQSAGKEVAAVNAVIEVVTNLANLINNIPDLNINAENIKSILQTFYTDTNGNLILDSPIDKVSDEWEIAFNAAKRYNKEISDTVDITRNIRIDKNGKRSISYRVSDSNGKQVIVGSNGSLISATDKIKTSATDAKNLEKEQIRESKRIEKERIAQEKRKNKKETDDLNKKKKDSYERQLKWIKEIYNYEEKIANARETNSKTQDIDISFWEEKKQELKSLITAEEEYRETNNLKDDDYEKTINEKTNIYQKEFETNRSDYNKLLEKTIEKLREEALLENEVYDQRTKNSLDKMLSDEENELNKSQIKKYEEFANNEKDIEEQERIKKQNLLYADLESAVIDYGKAKIELAKKGKDVTEEELSELKKLEEKINSISKNISEQGLFDKSKEKSIIDQMFSYDKTAQKESDKYEKDIEEQERIKKQNLLYADLESAVTKYGELKLKISQEAREATEEEIKELKRLENEFNSIYSEIIDKNLVSDKRNKSITKTVRDNISKEEKERIAQEKTEEKESNSTNLKRINDLYNEQLNTLTSIKVLQEKIESEDLSSKDRESANQVIENLKLRLLNIQEEYNSELNKEYLKTKEILEVLEKIKNNQDFYDIDTNELVDIDKFDETSSPIYTTNQKNIDDVIYALQKTESSLISISKKSNSDIFNDAFQNAEQEIKKLNEELLSGNITIGRYKQNISEIEKNLNVAANAISIIDDPKDIQNALSIMDEYMHQISNGSAKLKGYNDQIGTATYSYKDQNNQIQTLTLSIKQLNKEQYAIVQSFGKSKDAGNSFSKFLDGLKGKFLDLARYLITFVGFWDVINALKQGVSYVIEFDSAMTELIKVSNDSAESLKNFGKESFNIAREIGAIGKEVVNSAADWARLGYNIQEASELAKNSNIYANVGDIDIDTGSEHIISTLKGFDMEANKSIDIVDKFNEVGNNFAISSAGIGESLQRSAASFKTANTDLDSAIALITTANETIQDPEKVGTMYKTVSARIRGAKIELEQAGLETEGMVESTSELRDLIMSMTGFDIMENENTYKNLREILQGIGKAWEGLEDVEKAGLLEKLAGKNHSNTLAAVLNNYERIEEVYQTSINSAGSAIKENEKYMNSIQGHLNQISNSWQELWTNGIDSEIVKIVLKLADVVLQLANNFGLLPTIIGAAVGAFGIFKNINLDYS